MALGNLERDGDQRSAAGIKTVKSGLEFGH